MRYVISQMLARLATATLVEVITVHAGGVSALTTVDVQPIVNQIDGIGTATPHGTIYKMPAWRVLSANGQIVNDPVVGDIGLAIFCHSDISAAVANMAVSNPGSFRKFDWADGIYLGGLFNEEPTQSIEITAQSIVITPGSGGVVVNGNLTATGTITGQTDVIAATVSGKTHVHSGVSTGSGDTGEPV